MTNLLAAITVSLLVTNAEIRWPTRMVADPSPIGPNGEMYAVFVGHYEPITTSQWRTNVVIVRRLEVTTIPELGISKTNKNEWVSEVHTPQKRIEVWDSAEAIVLPRSSNMNDWAWPTNTYGTNFSIFTTVTNLWQYSIVTNK